LRELYARNFGFSTERIHGDIRDAKSKIPKHDILCAGFPCQPFSKSGFQHGSKDKVRGTLFAEILHVLDAHKPRVVLLENVGNFEQHDSGKTWSVVREELEKRDYCVRGTEHVRSGGHGLISPHHLGFPQTRERFFVIASKGALPIDPFPSRDRNRKTDLAAIVQNTKDLSATDRLETRLSAQQTSCVEHWNSLLASLPDDYDVPSFPIWGDELYARYPFVERSPASYTKSELIGMLRRHNTWLGRTKPQILELLPSYARSAEPVFPAWKIQFIRSNRRFFRAIQSSIPQGWAAKLRRFPPSLRKLEWNCKGDELDLWNCVLQFRPSGLRAKRYTTSPALVAMTATQIPILGPKKRFISRMEGLRLQGFPDDFELPVRREDAFRALGNAVHVGVATAIARAALQLSPASGAK